jgi:hypothetical protein
MEPLIKMQLFIKEPLVEMQPFIKEPLLEMQPFIKEALVEMQPFIKEPLVLEQFIMAKEKYFNQPFYFIFITARDAQLIEELVQQIIKLDLISKIKLIMENQVDCIESFMLVSFWLLQVKHPSKL